MHKYRWSDLEYVFSVASTGSVAAAARVLGVNHTTVLRRVHAFEEEINLRIFERLRSGYTPTPEGGMFLDAAHAIDSTIAELNRKIVGSETALEGTVTITSTDTIVPLVMDALAKFKSHHPSVVVNVRVANEHLNLERRESDIAIRASANPPTHLVSRRVCDLRFGVYATPDLAEKYIGTPLEQRPWIGMDLPLSTLEVGEWLERRVSPDWIAFHANNFNTLRDLAETSLGQGILPRHVGDVSKKLVPILLADPLPILGIWVLSHEDLLRAPRVRATMDFIFNGLREKRAVFEGEEVEVSSRLEKQNSD